MSAVLGWSLCIALVVNGPRLQRLARAIQDRQFAAESRWKADDLDALRRMNERVTGGHE